MLCASFVLLIDSHFICFFIISMVAYFLLVFFFFSSYLLSSFFFFFFFFNDTATTEIYTLSLHDALPILEDLGFYDPRHSRDGPRLDRNDEGDARPDQVRRRRY